LVNVETRSSTRRAVSDDSSAPTKAAVATSKAPDPLPDRLAGEALAGVGGGGGEGSDELGGELTREVREVDDEQLLGVLPSGLHDL